MAYKTIREWPESERPRERLLSHGTAALTNAHLIAIILRTGGSGRSAVDLAMELMERFQTLKGIAEAPIAEIRSIKGLGNAKAAQMKAALELGKRLSCEHSPKGPAFSTGRDVHAYFAPRFAGLRKEVFYSALLDAKNRVFQVERISEGTLTSSVIHPREAFRTAIRESAAAVIFVHNHPSGDPTPSRDDVAVTERLSSAGETVGIPVLDHVIVADDSFVSMLEQGHLRSR